MWQAIQYVGTGLALVAFLAAVASLVARMYIQQKKQLIETASESDRPALVRDALEFFHVDTAGLTREQRFTLARDQIDARMRRFTITAMVTCLLAVLLGVLTVVAVNAVRPASSAAPTSAAPTVAPSPLSFLEFGQSRNYVEQPNVLGVPISNEARNADGSESGLLLAEFSAADGTVVRFPIPPNADEKTVKEYIARDNKRYDDYVARFTFATYRRAQLNIVVRYDKASNESSGLSIEPLVAHPDCKLSDLRLVKPLQDVIQVKTSLCLGTATFADFLPETGPTLRNPAWPNEGMSATCWGDAGRGGADGGVPPAVYLVCSHSRENNSDSPLHYLIQIGVESPAIEGLVTDYSFDERSRGSNEDKSDSSGNYATFLEKFGKLHVGYVAISDFLATPDDMPPTSAESSFN